jgi:hemolysin activation/secretion protein
VEIYTPDIGFGDESGLRSRALAFYDYGYAARNRPQPGEVRAESIASYGLGLRAFYRDTVSIRLDLSRVAQSGLGQNTGDLRLQGSLSVFF